MIDRGLGGNIYDRTSALLDERRHRGPRQYVTGAQVHR
jgi:hypothetical protein